jgi:iron complex transport system ATP-binding protein
MIQAEAATYAVGERPLIRDIHLALTPGRLIVIVGPNGAGKSTLLRTMTGELKATGGRITLDGSDISHIAADKLARRRAVVVQHSVLAFAFTVMEVVLLGITVPGLSEPDRQTRQAALSMLDRLGLGHLAGRIYTSLSGGERQRVHIARALCQLESARTPPQETTLFVDEPTSSLDIAHQLVVLDELKRQAASGRAVLAVLHDLNLAAGHADDVLLLHAGRKLAFGTPGEVLTDELLSEAFGCRVRMNTPPPGSVPYLLPQACGLS